MKRFRREIKDYFLSLTPYTKEVTTDEVILGLLLGALALICFFFVWPFWLLAKLINKL